MITNFARFMYTNLHRPCLELGSACPDIAIAVHPEVVLQLPQVAPVLDVDPGPVEMAFWLAHHRSVDPRAVAHEGVHAQKESVLLCVYKNTHKS